MKADLDASGQLTLRPESPLEAYAMNKWAQDNWQPDGGHWKGGAMVLSIDYAQCGPLKMTSAPCSDCRDEPLCREERLCAFAVRK